MLDWAGYSTSVTVMLPYPLSSGRECPATLITTSPQFPVLGNQTLLFTNNKKTCKSVQYGQYGAFSAYIPYLNLTSSASRSPSPSRLNPSAVIRIAIPG